MHVRARVLLSCCWTVTLMRVAKMPGLLFGAEVTGVDLRALTPANAAVIKAAWLEHGLLLIRGQELEPAHEVAPCSPVARLSLISNKMLPVHTPF